MERKTERWKENEKKQRQRNEAREKRKEWH
jgi:hypothetical protein